jgi:hypothetical protein
MLSGNLLFGSSVSLCVSFSSMCKVFNEPDAVFQSLKTDLIESMFCEFNKSFHLYLHFLRTSGCRLAAAGRLRTAVALELSPGSMTARTTSSWRWPGPRANDSESNSKSLPVAFGMRCRLGCPPRGMVPGPGTRGWTMGPTRPVGAPSTLLPQSLLRLAQAVQFRDGGARVYRPGPVKPIEHLSGSPPFPWRRGDPPRVNPQGHTGPGRTAGEPERTSTTLRLRHRRTHQS